MNKSASLLCGIFLLGCASSGSTKLLSVWKDPDAGKRQGGRVIVVGVSNQNSARRLFEDTVVAELAHRGAEAVPSYTIFPSMENLDKSQVVDKIKKQGFDVAVVTRLIEKKNIKTVVPGSTRVGPQNYYHSFGGYMRTSYNYVYSPDYTIDEEVVVLETNVYKVESGKLIYSAASETLVGGSRKSLIKNFIKVIIKNYSENEEK